MQTTPLKWIALLLILCTAACKKSKNDLPAPGGTVYVGGSLQNGADI